GKDSNPLPDVQAVKDAQEIIAAEPLNAMKADTTRSSGADFHTAIVAKLKELILAEEQKSPRDEPKLTKQRHALAQIQELNPDMSGLKDDTKAELYRQLGEKLKKVESDTEERIDQLKASGKVLAEISPTFDPVALQAFYSGLDTSLLDSRDVLDGVIAILRYQYIGALREDGNQSSRANNLADALAAAYKQRQDKVYIRPAWTYLRNSY